MPSLVSRPGAQGRPEFLSGKHGSWEHSGSPQGVSPASPNAALPTPGRQQHNYRSHPMDLIYGFRVLPRAFRLRACTQWWESVLLERFLEWTGPCRNSAVAAWDHLPPAAAFPAECGRRRSLSGKDPGPSRTPGSEAGSPVFGTLRASLRRLLEDRVRPSRSSEIAVSLERASK